MSVVPRTEYRRPQLRRPDRTNLNGEWYFAFDDEDMGLARGRQGVTAEGLRSADRFQIFFRIILPLSKAPSATLAVLSFLTNWNDFLWPVYVLFTPESLTQPPGLSILQGAYTTDYAVIMAGGVVAGVPVLFIIAQRFIIRGVVRSGLKG